MIFNALRLTSDRPIDIDTEIRFAIAASRVDGIELIRFDISREDDIVKFFNSVTKILKKMKSAGQIQFYATPASFTNSDAAAEFLRNKYSNHLSNLPSISDKEAFVFVKL